MRVVWISTGLMLGAAMIGAAQESPVSFAKDVKPLLENRCLKCHGAAVQLSRLDLRTRESALKGGDKGAAIIPGKAEDSRLYRLIAGLEKPTMPMDGKLSDAEIASIRQWINQGAPWEEGGALGKDSAKQAASQLAALEEMPLPPEARNYWAFRKPVKAAVPAAPASSSNPIDAFLAKTLLDQGLTAALKADRLTLLRRAYMDLIGLPPSPAEAAEFLADNSPDAWKKLIDKLLASPHYGERWGRHWLDVARYADSNGFEMDFNRPNAWRYRDYVIRSFNEDKPFSTFLKEQIAGDELEKVTHDSLIATGFLRNYAKVGYREKDNPEFRYEYLDDMIATIGRGILGLTVNCARCHNHKFDPIAQKDYYAMQAALFPYIEVDFPLAPREEAEAYQKKVAEVDARIAQLRAAIRSLEEPYRAKIAAEKYKKYPENVQQAIATPEEKRTEGQKLLANQVIRTTLITPDEIEKIIPAELLAKRKELGAQIRATEQQRPKPIPMASGITDGDYRFTPDGPGDEPAPGKGKDKETAAGTFRHAGPGRYEPPPSYFLIRGDLNSHGSLMKPGFVGVATYGNPPIELPPADGHSSGRRRALAEWLASEENPLTPRVIVNRIWHHHFGRGIVATLDNFGKMGDVPSHPELLDWLTVEFIERGWSIKNLHRLIMTSDAYQMSSQSNPEANVAKDPDNKYLWRFRIQRLDAEIVRDAIMTASGGINLEVGGPAVFPPIQPEILRSMRNGIWNREDEGAKVWRRSVYVYRKRGLAFPMFEVFDLPDQNVSCGRRNVSTVPTQALTLLNNDFAMRQAKLFATRLSEAAPNEPSRQIDLAYRIALTRPPSEEEKSIAIEFLKKRSLADFTHVVLNLNEFLYTR